MKESLSSALATIVKLGNDTLYSVIFSCYRKSDEWWEAACISIDSLTTQLDNTGQGGGQTYNKTGYYWTKGGSLTTLLDTTEQGGTVLQHYWTRAQSYNRAS